MLARMRGTGEKEFRVSACTVRADRMGYRGKRRLRIMIVAVDRSVGIVCAWGHVIIDEGDRWQPTQCLTGMGV